MPKPGDKNYMPFKAGDEIVIARTQDYRGERIFMEKDIGRRAKVKGIRTSDYLGKMYIIVAWEGNYSHLECSYYPEPFDLATPRDPVNQAAHEYIRSELHGAT